MRVLITGTAGFLGSHLAARFLTEGYEVNGIDNYLTGSEENTWRLQEYEHFTFIEQDVSEYLDIEGDLDGVLHFASPASPTDYLRYPIQTLKVGSLGTYRTLGVAKAKGARYLLASTSEVYGDPQVHPQKEDYWGHVNPVGIRGVYDEAKRFSEAMVMAYHRYHNLDTRIARIFNTYGPGMRLDDGRVISNFLAQALRGESLTIFGTGDQTRSFCYVDEMVEAIFRLFRSDCTSPVNLGNPAEHSILDVAGLVEKVLEREISTTHHELPEDDPKIRQPDISLATEYLGWQPDVDLEEGLRLSLPYFREKLEPVG